MDRVKDFMPTAAYHALSSMSEHALISSEEPLAHRVLIVAELAGIARARAQPRRNLGATC